MMNTTRRETLALALAATGGAAVPVAARASGGEAKLSHEPVWRAGIEGQRTADLGDFMYDGTDLILEGNYYTNEIRRRYVHGPGIDQPIVWYEGSGTSDRRFLSSDERGSVISVTLSRSRLRAWRSRAAAPSTPGLPDGIRRSTSLRAPKSPRFALAARKASQRKC